GRDLGEQTGHRLRRRSMHVALLFYNSESGVVNIPAESLREMEMLFDDYGMALYEAGVLVGGEILQFSPTATTLTRRSGTTEIQDGPFAETKEGLAGVFVIDVADADAALAWAEKCPGVSYGTIEVRPVATWLAGGTWMAPDGT